jgi:hypothetical protein
MWIEKVIADEIRLFLDLDISLRVISSGELISLSHMNEGFGAADDTTPKAE